MNEEQVKQAFMQYLQQKSGAKNQQELEAYIQQLGEEGLKKEYAEFMQLMQQQQVQAAKFGAKLNYINTLRGNCPEGYTMQFYKKGGTLCKKCMKKVQAEETPKNPVDAFRCGRKMKKAACGMSVKKKDLIKADNGVKVPNKYPMEFRRQVGNLGNGYQYITDVVANPNDGQGNYMYDWPNILAGRMIYVTPTRNDTLYFNYPEDYDTFGGGAMQPVAKKAKNQAKAKANFYKQVRRTAPAPDNKEVEKARRNALNGK